jgi:imidazolonepropionase-like amidohydrolase
MRPILPLLLLLAHLSAAQAPDSVVLYRPARVFDGETLHPGWQVLVSGRRIAAVGPNLTLPNRVRTVELPNCTLLPGLIEGHSHLLLHPYDEVKWDDQVLRESRAERVARAVVHARKTLEAGFTTVRDLGSEGADFDDVGLRQAIEKGIIPGPRVLAAGRALVATGSYGPKNFRAGVEVPQGAEEADGTDRLARAVRAQLGQGIDLVKVYADYRWGLMGESKPTFLQSELDLIVQLAASAGRVTVAHATTAEGMRRAALAGVRTIEHGDGGTRDVLQLMKKKGVALCPTLAATEATSQYRGWKKGQEPDPERVAQKKRSFALARDVGVTMCMGGDVGVFAHGDNAREMELMVAYGMKPTEVLRAATATNADVFGLADQVGRVKAGLLADLTVVEGDPTKAIADVRQVRLVLQSGRVVFAASSVAH